MNTSSLSPRLHWDDAPETAATRQKQALEFLAGHDLAATPVNYAVAYVHAAGDNAALSAAIAQALVSKAAIDSYLMRDLFAHHFTGDFSQDLLDQQEGFGKILEEMLAALAQGNKESAEYRLTLDRNIAALKERPATDSLLEIATILVNATVTATRSSKQMEKKLESAQQQVNDLYAELEQTRLEASHDSLTGLVNRGALERHLHRLIEEKAAPFSLLMMDIDHFKRFNDNYGHLLGDAVIRKVANVIKETVKEPGVAARYGGEEFSVILPGTAIDMAMGTAESIRIAVSNLKLVRKQTLEKLPSITISIGVTEYREGDDPKALFSSADFALYHAKESGRNRVMNGLAL